MEQSHFSSGVIFFFKWGNLTFCGSELNGSNLTIGNVTSYLLELSRVNRVNILVDVWHPHESDGQDST